MFPQKPNTAQPKSAGGSRKSLFFSGNSFPVEEQQRGLLPCRAAPALPEGREETGTLLPLGE